MDHKLREYFLNYKEHTDTFILNETFCYDSRNVVCSCEPKCCQRQYYNRFYGNPIYFPIEKEHVTDKGILEEAKNKKIEYTEIPSLSFKDSIKRMDIANSTAKNYLSKYNTWIKKELDFTNPEIFIKKLNELYKPETSRTHLTALISYIHSLSPSERIEIFGDNPHPYMYYYCTMTLMRLFNTKLKSTGEMTPKEKENWITYKELEEFVETLEQQERLLLLLYLKVGALRSDYCTIKINNIDTKKDNYLDIKNKSFIFNELVKTKEKIEIKIPLEIFKEIISFIDQNTFREYLIEDEFGNPFTNNGFSTYVFQFMSGTGKKIGIQMIRKIVATEQNKTVQFPEVIAQNSRNMGHTPEYNTDYYTKML